LETPGTPASRLIKVCPDWRSGKKLSGSQKDRAGGKSLQRVSQDPESECDDKKPLFAVRRCPWPTQRETYLSPPKTKRTDKERKSLAKSRTFEEQHDVSTVRENKFRPQKDRKDIGDLKIRLGFCYRKGHRGEGFENLETEDGVPQSLWVCSGYHISTKNSTPPTIQNLKQNACR